MPIRSELRHNYRKEWHKLSKRLRERRAQNACECDGICGGHDGPCGAVHLADRHPRTGGHVLLTCAHLDQDPRDHNPDRLLIMCQSCHVRYDRQPEQEALRARVALEIAGQLTIFEPKESQKRLGATQNIMASWWSSAIGLVHRRAAALTGRARPLTLYELCKRTPTTIGRFCGLLQQEGWSTSTVRRAVISRGVVPVERHGSHKYYDPKALCAAMVGEELAKWAHGLGPEAEP